MTTQELGVSPRQSLPVVSRQHSSGRGASGAAPAQIIANRVIVAQAERLYIRARASHPDRWDYSTPAAL
jgi:hypothetical protein